tara:strand:+ start:325 stop:828 length:504 start_codon:yes stop_codon:yes gene_type:complete
MNKHILSEQALYYGDVKMPEGFEINSLEFSKTIFDSLSKQKDFIFSKEWDKLNTYLIDFLKLKFKLSLINKKSWGTICTPNENVGPLLDVDPVDLKSSPDFTVLYGINTVDCHVKIYYDDNRRKGRSWDIELEQNKFIMFPSSCTYSIFNKQTNNLNFIQNITYEYI